MMILCGQQGRFDELPGRSLSTIFASAPETGVLRTRTPAQCPYPPWKQIFRPCTLGFVGLAIVVALWGYGYKLSLYHRHDQNSSRVSVAKMWIEPRLASAVPASKLKARPHVYPGSQALSLSIQKFPNLKCAVTFTLPLVTRDVAYINLLIPSRSPPSLHFRLA